MAANLIGPGRTACLDDDEPAADRVVALFVQRPPVAPGREAPSVQRGVSATILRFDLHFTAADHAALAAWAGRTDHGYDRLRLDRGVLEDGNWVSYALIYVPGQAWSAWGVTRRDNHVEVWRCATGQTVSYHAQMADALASLPHATDRRRALQTDSGQAEMRNGSRQHGTR